MIKLINEIIHITGGFQYTTTSEARAVAEKCCEVACKAVRNTRPMTPNDRGVLGMEEAIEAIRKAFGVNDEQ